MSTGAIPRRVRRLTHQEQLAIASADPAESNVALARRLGRDRGLVWAARTRIAERGWGCPVRWTTCRACGQPLASSPNGPPPPMHPHCTPAARRKQRGYQLTAGGRLNPNWIETDAATGCELWLGAHVATRRDPRGRPQANQNGRTFSARRLRWQEIHGAPPPTALRLTCGNPRCINPAHAQLRTPGETLDPDQLAEIRASAGRELVHETAARFGISPATVSRIRGHPSQRRGDSLAYRLRDTLPAERPAAVNERDWAIVRLIAEGATLRAAGAAHGLTRQRADQLARRVLTRLTPSDSAPPDADPPATAAIVITDHSP